MEQVEMEQDLIDTIVKALEGITSITVRMSESKKEEVDEFLEELSELVSSVVHNKDIQKDTQKDIQKDITLIAETLLLKERIRVTVLEEATTTVAIILKYLVSQTEYPDQKEVQELLTEYLNEGEPMHCVLAQKMLDDIDLVSKAKSIFEKWIQIETDLIEKVRKDMCE